MRMSLIAIVGLATLSGAASAQNFDSNDQVDYRPGSSASAVYAPQNVAPLESVGATGDDWYMGRYGLTKDPSDIRRWEEKGE